MNKEKLYHELDIDNFIKDSQALVKQLESGEITAFLIHLAEGTDPDSRDEFRKLKEKGLLRKETAIIHGIALMEEDFMDMERGKVKLIWSPKSNYILYGNGKTANIPLALKHHITVSLAPDWSITGSDTILKELKFASQINSKEYKSILQESDFLKMATVNAAETAGVADKIGAIKPGFFADIVVLKGDKSILESKIQDISLIIVDGQPIYGDVSVMELLGKAGDYETLNVCGVPKGIDITSDDETIPGGNQTLLEVLTLLHSYYPKLTPLYECNN